MAASLELQTAGHSQKPLHQDTQGQASSLTQRGAVGSSINALALFLLMQLPYRERHTSGLIGTHLPHRNAHEGAPAMEGQAEGAYRATERYLILRHGETDFNSDGILQGSSDRSRLNSVGKSQARHVGSELAMLKDMKISRVFVSPLARATATLDLVAEALGRELPERVILPELREIDLYSWEGKSKDELKKYDSKGYAAWKNDMQAFTIDGHRPFAELWDRAKLAFQAMRSTHNDVPDGITLVVCHDKIGQALFFHALGYDASYLRKISFPNAHVLELEWPIDRSNATRWRWRLPLHVGDSEWQSVFKDKHVSYDKR